MRHRLLSIVLAVSCTHAALAQDSLQPPLPTRQSPVVKPEWFSARDARNLGIGVLALGVLSLADEPIANAMRRLPSDPNSLMRRSSRVLGRSGDPGALIVSSSLYLVGALTHHSTLTDASKHAALSIAVTTLISQPVKWSSGRARPNVEGSNAYTFHPFRNLKADYNGLPSGHAAAAFALAGAYGAELSRTNPEAARIVKPALYGVATVLGAARVYDNRHWLTDVVAGAVIGDVVARRIVKMSHRPR